jgi:Uma2 family endonuclease
MTLPTMATTGGVPRLCAGDRLSRDEFERRYNAMPECKKAELVEGVVYMPSPVTSSRHGEPHAMLMTWLGTYVAATPGVRCADNATVRLDLDNEPQPDGLLRRLPEHGGRARLSAEGYVEGPPELVVEVAASSASYDLHDKLRAYRRNGVPEYLVWRTDDAAVDWFALRSGAYERLPHGTDGVVRSAVFAGLCLDVPALLAGDLAAVLRRLGDGLAARAVC